MLVPPQVFPEPDSLGRAVAARIVDRLDNAPTAEPFLLGCPGGRSLRSSYRMLGRIAAERRLDLSRLVIVMMDEYVELNADGIPASVDPRSAYSCRHFAMTEIVTELNTALRSGGATTGQLVQPGNLWLPDPTDPEEYERRLVAAGGINVFLLASGAGDGHVAFNPPDSDRASRTRVVALPDSTRTDNLATFPAFAGELEAVPRHGVTVGIATIRELSSEAIMVVHGSDKQRAAQRLAEAGQYEPDWPATVITECRAPSLFCDQAALPTHLLARRP